MISTRLLIAAGAYCLILCEPCRAEEASHREAMDFEAADAWRTAPDLLDHFDENELWSTRTIPFDELASGVKLSSKHVKSGEFSGEWSDHPRYPTIHTRQVPSDWRGAKSLVFWAWSEEATGEKITVAIRSDNPKTVCDPSIQSVSANPRTLTIGHRRIYVLPGLVAVTRFRRDSRARALKCGKSSTHRPDRLDLVRHLESRDRVS